MDLKEKVVEKKEVKYFGIYRTVDSKATPIPKIGDEYKPENEDQIKCLEYLVSKGLITKE